MISKFQLSAVCVATMAYGTCGASNLNNSPDNGASTSAAIGQFTTKVPDDQLFAAVGRRLCCDLSYSVSGKQTVIAPKGSELNQTVPAVVWQYAGLLPMNDYVKSAAIHNVSSDVQTRSWQDVQHYFYDGLLVEGADEIDAKIAYAGAYAFAPRWPSVELVEVIDTDPTNPGGIYYEVKYNEPPERGMSVENFRALSLHIFQQAEEMSLQDIQVLIDHSDDLKTKSRERASAVIIAGAVPNDGATGTDATAKTDDVVASVEPVAAQSAEKDTTDIVVGSNSDFLSSIDSPVNNSIANTATSTATSTAANTAASTTSGEQGESLGKAAESVSKEDKSADEGDKAAGEEDEASAEGDESANKEGECATQDGDSDSNEEDESGSESEDCANEDGESEGEEDDSAAEEDESNSEEDQSADQSTDQSANKAVNKAATATGQSASAAGQSNSNTAPSSTAATKARGSVAAVNTDSPISSSIFGGVTPPGAIESDVNSKSAPEEVVKTVDESIVGGSAQSGDDSAKPAINAQPTAQPTEIVDSPVDELLTSDEPEVNFDLQLGVVVDESDVSQGDEIDLSVLANDSLLEDETLESDIARQTNEGETDTESLEAETAASPKVASPETASPETVATTENESEWVVLPDGSLILQSVGRLYEELVR